MKAFISRRNVPHDQTFVSLCRNAPKKLEDEPLGGRMGVDANKCTGCGECVPLCCGNCIEMKEPH